MNLFVCYPKCSTCKKAENWLKENEISYELRNIKENRPSKEELEAWHKKSGLELKKFFNTSGLLYKSMELKDKLPGMSEEEMLRTGCWSNARFWSGTILSSSDLKRPSGSVL